MHRLISTEVRQRERDIEAKIEIDKEREKERDKETEGERKKSMLHPRARDWSPRCAEREGNCGK